MAAIVEEMILSPNYSGRGGAEIVKGIAHTTEGWAYPGGRKDAGYYFQSPSSGVSSHWTNDDGSETNVVCCVYEQYAAWTGAGLNSYSLQIEQCAYTSWSRDTWLNHHGVLLRSTANIFRYIADTYHLPLRELSNAETQDSWTKGFSQHFRGGSMAGGHMDCGQYTYPMDIVLQWAQEGTSAPPTPTPAPEEIEDMYITVPPKKINPDTGEVEPYESLNISLDGMFSNIGICTDAGTYPESTGLRVAYHVGGNVHWETHKVWSDGGHEKVVHGPSGGKKFDGLRIDRLDDNRSVVIINTGR